MQVCTSLQSDNHASTPTRPDALPVAPPTASKHWRHIQTFKYTHPFNGPFPGLPRWVGTRKVKPIWILLKQETVSGSGISWAICKSAPRPRQITTPTPHHLVFYRPDALPAAQPTVSRTEGTHSNNVWLITCQSKFCCELMHFSLIFILQEKCHGHCLWQCYYKLCDCGHWFWYCTFLLSCLPVSVGVISWLNTLGQLLVMCFVYVPVCIMMNTVGLR